MPAPPAADLVFYGGRILTLDRSARVAEALAVAGERVFALGTSAEMLALAGPGTRRVDLAGRTAVPGLIDAHAHLDREGLKTLCPSLAGAPPTARAPPRAARLDRQQRGPAPGRHPARDAPAVGRRPDRPGLGKRRAQRDPRRVDVHAARRADAHGGGAALHARGPRPRPPRGDARLQRVRHDAPP